MLFLSLPCVNEEIRDSDPKMDVAKTIGIVVVTSPAACAERPSRVRMTWTFRATSSAAACPVRLPLCGADLENEVPAFYIAQVPESSTNWFRDGIGANRKITNSENRLPALRADCVEIKP
jgi:hypothetical protein